MSRRLTKFLKKVVVFADNRIQVLEKTGEVRGERELAVYVIFGLISVLFMLISNMVMWRARKDSAAVVAFALAAIVAFAAAAFVAFAAAFVAFAAAIAVVVAVVVVADTQNRWMYIAFAVVYYAAMAVALFI